MQIKEQNMILVLIRSNMFLLVLSLMIQDILHVARHSNSATMILQSVKWLS